jgi:hypothetical protein
MKMRFIAAMALLGVCAGAGAKNEGARVVLGHRSLYASTTISLRNINSNKNTSEAVDCCGVVAGRVLLCTSISSSLQPEAAESSAALPGNA